MNTSRMILALLLALALQACGGGDDCDEPDRKTPQPPDCSASAPDCR